MTLPENAPAPESVPQAAVDDSSGLHPAEPTPTEPALAEPTAAKPTLAEPTPAEPTPAEPTPAEPTPTEPTPTEPTLAEPAATDPTAPVSTASAPIATDDQHEADPVLLAAVDQARAALAEITPAGTIGELVGHAVEGERVLSLFFASKLPGYPDWHWTATLARVSDTDEPSVLEVELLPGEGSVLSPAWVPWADRLTADALVDDSESEFDDDDDLDDDDDDDDDEGEDDDSAGSDDDEDSGDFDDDDDDPDADDSDGDSDDDGSDGDDHLLAATDRGSGASDERRAAADRELAQAFAVGVRRDRDGIDIDSIAESVAPDAGAAFDATDDFTDAGDPEDLEGLDPEGDSGR